MTEFFNALKNKRARKEWLKSMLVGFVCTVVDFLITALIIYIEGYKEFAGFAGVVTGATVTGTPHETPISVYLLATVISFALSTGLKYILNIFFVFQYGNVGKNKQGFLKFVVFALIGLTITTVGNAVGYGALHGNVWVVKIVVALICFVFNFFTSKYFVFNIALIRDDENTINL